MKPILTGLLLLAGCSTDTFLLGDDTLAGQSGGGTGASVPVGESTAYDSGGRTDDDGGGGCADVMDPRCCPGGMGPCRAAPIDPRSGSGSGEDGCDPTDPNCGDSGDVDRRPMDTDTTGGRSPTDSDCGGGGPVDPDCTSGDCDPMEDPNCVGELGMCDSMDLTC